MSDKTRSDYAETDTLLTCTDCGYQDWAPTFCDEGDRCVECWIGSMEAPE